jgi:hypothetical protein
LCHFEIINDYAREIVLSTIFNRKAEFLFSKNIAPFLFGDCNIESILRDLDAGFLFPEIALRISEFFVLEKRSFAFTIKQQPVLP